MRIGLKYKVSIYSSIFILLLLSCGNRYTEKTNKVKKDMISDGLGKFVFADYKPFADKPINVFYYKPKSLPPDAPIMILMHGNSRAAESYRNAMSTYAEKNRFLLIVPEFSKENFPKSRDYHQGGVFDENRKMKNKEDWAFSIIEPLFDYVQSLTNNESTGYILYGFSAGSQFAHRYTWFFPESRAKQTIAASAGSYTMPDYGIEYYYGLKDLEVQVPEANLVKAFAKDLIVAVGEADTIRSREDLPKSLKAEEQGETRVARAENYYKFAQKLAKEKGVPFNWKFVLVPRVGHKQGQMAEHVSDMLNLKE